MIVENEILNAIKFFAVLQGDTNKKYLLSSL